MAPRKWDSAKDDGLYPSGYYLFTQEPSASLRAAIGQNEKERLMAMGKGPKSGSTADASLRSSDPPSGDPPSSDPPSYEGRLWKGWVLPATDTDSWLFAGAATYRGVLQSAKMEEALDSQRAAWRRLELSPDTPASHFQRERARGVLFLDSLRRQMGDTAFLKLMNDYFAANTTKTVTAKSFLEKAGAQIGEIDPPDGPAYVTSDLWRQLSSSVIVYGTMREAGANRYVAEQMQNHFLDYYEGQMPIYKDFEVTDDLLRHRDVVFVGRPESNSALARWADKIGLDYPGAAFRIDGKVHASEREGLIFSAKNPLDATHMVIVMAGNDALSTVKTQKLDLSADQYVIFRDGGEPVRGFVRNETSVARGTGGSH